MAPFSKRKNKYSEENLRDAVAAVKTKLLTTRAAADKYGVPQTTIMDRIKGRYSAKILKAGKCVQLAYEYCNAIKERQFSLSLLLLICDANLRIHMLGRNIRNLDGIFGYLPFNTFFGRILPGL